MCSLGSLSKEKVQRMGHEHARNYILIFVSLGILLALTGCNSGGGTQKQAPATQADPGQVTIITTVAAQDILPSLSEQASLALGVSDNAGKNNYDDDDCKDDNDDCKDDDDDDHDGQYQDLVQAGQHKDRREYDHDDSDHEKSCRDKKDACKLPKEKKGELRERYKNIKSVIVNIARIEFLIRDGKHGSGPE